MRMRRMRRTWEQIISGLGSLAEVGPYCGDDKITKTAKLVFLEVEELVRVKLIDPKSPPICIAWLGASRV